MSRLQSQVIHNRSPEEVTSCSMTFLSVQEASLSRCVNSYPKCNAKMSAQHFRWFPIGEAFTRSINEGTNNFEKIKGVENPCLIVKRKTKRSMGAQGGCPLGDSSAIRTQKRSH